MLGGRRGESTGSRRREVTDLYATVLEVVKRYHGAARITRVSYGAGMPVDRLRSFVERLLALGLLQSEELDGRPVYDVTARGQEFLDTYWRMRGYVEILGGTAGDGQAARPPTRGAAEGPPTLARSGTVPTEEMIVRRRKGAAHHARSSPERPPARRGHQS